jgi:NAD(P)-dependent dehydrogenase (short-subunit alcohol dehydrogenase family)
MELRGRQVLVTGGDGAVGQAVARRLGAEGCALTVAGARGDVLEALAVEVGGRALVADPSSDDGVGLLADACGEVDLLVVCAGAVGSGALTDYSPGDIDRVIAVNLRGPLALARVFGEQMVARGAGHVVFVSSLAGKSASPGAALLSATMFGVRGLALGLRQDWGPLGVGVSLVSPGPLGEALVLDGAAPAGFRPKVPEDVAAAVVKAVRHDRAEVDVADPVMRAGVVLGQLAPQAAARLHRLGGGGGAV